MGQPDPDRICVDFGASEPHNSYADAPSNETDERLLEEVGQSMSAYCLHLAYYNFCRIHKTIRVTPAMESKITDHAWEIGKLLA
jgi:hypothetical protein